MTRAGDGEAVDLTALTVDSHSFMLERRSMVLLLQLARRRRRGPGKGLSLQPHFVRRPGWRYDVVLIWAELAEASLSRVG
jgi:hypothetical protein